MILGLLIMIISQYRLIIDDIQVLSAVSVGSISGLINYGANFKKVGILRSHNQEKEYLEELERALDSKGTLLFKIVEFVGFLIFAIYGVVSSLYINNINFTYISAVLVANIWLYESECSRMRRLSIADDDLYSVSTFLEVFNSLIRLIHTSTLIYFIVINSF